MFEEYHQLDDEICRIEEDIEFATDQEIDELKFKRAKLKDALYSAVRKHESGAGSLSTGRSIGGRHPSR